MNYVHLKETLPANDDLSKYVVNTNSIYNTRRQSFSYILFTNIYL